MALEVGIAYNDFWGLSLAEISLIIEASQKREKRQMEINLGYIYNLSYLICQGVNDAKQFPKSLEAAFPNFFNKKQTWQEQKEIFSKYADWHNTQNGGG